MDKHQFPGTILRVKDPYAVDAEEISHVSKPKTIRLLASSIACTFSSIGRGDTLAGEHPPKPS